MKLTYIVGDLFFEYNETYVYSWWVIKGNAFCCWMETTSGCGDPRKETQK